MAARSSKTIERPIYKHHNAGHKDCDGIETETIFHVSRLRTAVPLDNKTATAPPGSTRARANMLRYCREMTAHGMSMIPKGRFGRKPLWGYNG